MSARNHGSFHGFLVSFILILRLFIFLGTCDNGGCGDRWSGSGHDYFIRCSPGETFCVNLGRCSRACLNNRHSGGGNGGPPVFRCEKWETFDVNAGRCLPRMPDPPGHRPSGGGHVGGRCAKGQIFDVIAGGEDRHPSRSKNILCIQSDLRAAKHHIK